VAEPLALDGTTAAFGVSEVVDENMANAARVHAVENGEDLSGYTLIAFGGAAPLHAGRLCQKLGIDRFLVPPGAGVGSAIRFLRAPFSFEATRSTYIRLSEFSAPYVADTLSALEQEAAAFVHACDPDAALSFETKGFFRYVGQGWEIPVDLPGVPDKAAYLAAFEAAYKALFGRVVHGLDVEITSWSVRAATPVTAPEPVPKATPQPAPAPAGTRQLSAPAPYGIRTASVWHRYGLQPDMTLAGPAVLTERETTIIVPEGFTATMRADGCVEIAATGGTAAPSARQRQTQEATP